MTRNGSFAGSHGKRNLSPNLTSNKCWCRSEDSDLPLTEMILLAMKCSIICRNLYCCGRIFCPFCRRIPKTLPL